MNKLLFIIASLLLITLQGMAQNRLIQDKVLSEDGTPLPGATVTAVKANKSVITDAEGRFSVPVADNDTLRVSYVGYQMASVAIKQDQPLEAIVLKASVGSLNELVVTGYQKEKKKDLTGAVSVVDMKDIRNVPAGNPMKALQGHVPGVFITTDGAPGGNATVRIRGIGTLGNNDPLYIIDGMPSQRGLQELNPEDIASIQILKDASSATIYGSRAANGVIIVTTKRAQEGYSKINFNYSMSVQYYSHRQKMLSTEGRGKAYWQAAVNDHADPNDNQIYQYDWNKDYDNPVLNKIILPEYIDAAHTMKPANTDWFNEIAQTSLIQSYDLSFSNGHKKGGSFISLSYYDNKGIVKGTHAQKATARFNADYHFFDNRLNIGENLAATYIRSDLINSSDVLFSALVQHAIVPIHTVDGGWGGPAPGMTDRQNPVRLIEDNKQNHNHFARLFGNVYAELQILPDLQFKTSLGLDYNGNYARTLRKSYTSGFLSDPSNEVATSQDYGGNWIWQNTLTYKFNLQKNSFNFLAGEEQIKYLAQNFRASRRGYALENINYAYLDAGSSNKDNGGSGSGYALQSYFGKINYAYDNKYLASLTFRRDGSSRFGKANQYGNFPAFSLGWRLSEENFIKSIPAISDLKIRYGWGKTGNQDIANNATYTLYSAIYGTDPTWDSDHGSAYDITGAGSGQLPSGYTLIQQGNEALKWETTEESNYGIDFGFLDNKISGSIDYFVRKTSDILISPGYLAVVGEGGNHWFNGASMENRGIDFLISYNADLSKDLSLDISANASTFRNKITKLPEEVLTSYPGNGTDKTILGRSISSVFGYVADGLFTSQKEVDDYADQPGKGLGRIRYRDLNGDGQIDDKDRAFIGHMDPDFIYGLNISLGYKKFHFTLFLQGVQGQDIYNNNKIYTDFSSLWVGTNWGTRTLDAWTPANPASGIPALTLVDRNNEGRTSTYFIEDGSYLKVRNIQLSYDFDHLLGAKFPGSQIYLQASNLFTIKGKNTTAPDPETPNQSYPIPVVSTIGINIGL